MLFDCEISKFTADGKLIGKFLEYYNEAVTKKIDNIGWYIINDKFPDSKKIQENSNNLKE
jgi:hypothetical protein